MIPTQFGSTDDPYWVEVVGKFLHEGEEKLELKVYKSPTPPQRAHVTTGAHRYLVIEPGQDDAAVAAAAKVVAQELLAQVGQRLP